MGSSPKHEYGAHEESYHESQHRLHKPEKPHCMASFVMATATDPSFTVSAYRLTQRYKIVYEPAYWNDSMARQSQMDNVLVIRRVHIRLRKSK